MKYYLIILLFILGCESNNSIEKENRMYQAEILCKDVLKDLGGTFKNVHLNNERNEEAYGRIECEVELKPENGFNFRYFTISELNHFQYYIELKKIQKGKK